MKFLNKVIVIFGSEGKIGNSFKKHIIANGGYVSGFDIKKVKYSNNKYLIYFRGDINSTKDIKKFLNFTKKKFNKIDCVINCSYPKNNQSKNFSSLNIKNLRNNISSHLASSIMVSKIFADFFKKQRYGNLILLGSIQGIMPPKFDHYKNTDMYSPIEYTANKYAIIGIVKYLAKFYGKFNINVNSINPGGIFNHQNKKFLKKYRSSTLRKGILETQDLLSTLEYLIDNRSSTINGQNLVVDDGWSL